MAGQAATSSAMGAAGRSGEMAAAAGQGVPAGIATQDAEAVHTRLCESLLHRDLQVSSLLFSLLSLARALSLSHCPCVGSGTAIGCGRGPEQPQLQGCRAVCWRHAADLGRADGRPRGGAVAGARAG